MSVLHAIWLLSIWIAISTASATEPFVVGGDEWRAPAAISHVAFAPDGRRLLANTEEGAVWFALPSGKPTPALLDGCGEDGTGAGPVAISRDGKRIAIVCREDVAVLDASTGAVMLRVPANASGLSPTVAFSASGELGIVEERGRQGSPMTVTRISSAGELLGEVGAFDGHLVASPDGGGWPGSIRNRPPSGVWDAKGRSIGAASGLTDEVSAVAAAADGSVVAALSSFGQLIVVDVTSRRVA